MCVSQVQWRNLSCVMVMRVSPGIVFPAYVSLGMRVSPHIAISLGMCVSQIQWRNLSCVMVMRVSRIRIRRDAYFPAHFFITRDVCFPNSVAYLNPVSYSSDACFPGYRASRTHITRDACFPSVIHVPPAHISLGIYVS